MSSCSMFSKHFPKPQIDLTKLADHQKRSTPFLPKLSHFSSAVPGFYKKPHRERLETISHHSNLTKQEMHTLSQAITHTQQTKELWIDHAIENALGAIEIPLGIATYYCINHRDVWIPMCTEEPSVIAAASNGAKMVRTGKGFITSSYDPVSTAQITLQTHAEKEKDSESSLKAWEHILNSQGREAIAQTARKYCTSMERRGGGFRDVTWKTFPQLRTLSLYVHVDTQDAMGANYVNSLATHLADTVVSHLFPDAYIRLCIVTNLALGQMVHAQCCVPLSTFSSNNKEALHIMQSIEYASSFAQADIFRATTHNKGIMNGIDAVAIATGNDWRAIEAGAHAYASYHGSYQPLSHWSVAEDQTALHGRLSMPISTGVVGGMTRYHPLVQIVLKILGYPTARELAEIMAAVGLGQNLAALRALCDEGIQSGHMKLHRRREIYHQHI